MFHLLRRQLHRETRKPLVVMTPKKLLRYPRAVSSINDFATGGFKEVIDDPYITETSAVSVVAFCSGKVYYDALEKREERGTGSHVAIVRMEQLYPFPEIQVREILAKYSSASKVVWMQEEPENMGAWGYMLRKFPDIRPEYVGPDESAAPAPGSGKIFEKRHNAIFERLFSLSMAGVQS
jgi:2-oxoglutarate dehydrogenase E1 component